MRTPADDTPRSAGRSPAAPVCSSQVHFCSEACDLGEACGLLRSFFCCLAGGIRIERSRKSKTAAWVAFEWENHARLPACPCARLPWPKTAVLTWRSPVFFLPAACLPGLCGRRMPRHWPACLVALYRIPLGRQQKKSNALTFGVLCVSCACRAAVSYGRLLTPRAFRGELDVCSVSTLGIRKRRL